MTLLAPSDKDYWKRKYKDSWEMTAAKEEMVKEHLEKHGGCRLIPHGLGSLSRDFLPGNAESQGYKKGDPDFLVEGTNILIEVTGPNTDVPIDAALWVRPDKIKNAISDETRQHWIVHVMLREKLLRVIRIDHDFKFKYDRNEFKVVNPIIRGVRETYVEIPASCPCVQPIDILVAEIKAITSTKSRDVR